MRLIARRTLASLGFALTALLPLGCSAAEAPPANWIEGAHYKKALNPQEPADARKVEVNEVFWYGCPHCYALDPVIETWRAKMPGDAVFLRTPSTLGRAEGEMHARAFYVAEALGVSDKIHLPLFKAIHVEHRRMASLDDLRGLFASAAGVKAEDFDQATSSFMVDSRLRRADAAVRAYGITSVPTIVVDGRWYTNASLAGSNDKAIEVLNFLVEKQRKDRKLK